MGAEIHRPSLAIPFSFLIPGYFAGAGSKLHRGFNLESEIQEARDEATEESQEGGEVEEGGEEGRGKEAPGANAQESRAQDSEADAKGDQDQAKSREAHGFSTEGPAQDQTKSSAEDSEAFGYQAGTSNRPAESSA